MMCQTQTWLAENQAEQKNSRNMHATPEPAAGPCFLYCRQLVNRFQYYFQASELYSVSSNHK